MLKLGNILIFGDSYSSFEGWNPKGNGVWYVSGGHERSDVCAVEETWWHQLVSETDSTLVLNESYSGATVCNTERPTIPHTSFVYRLDALIEGGFFRENKIDTVFVFGGTNDSWIDSPVGENRYDNFTSASLDCVLPAFCYLLDRLQKVAPQARIVPILNLGLKEEIREGFLLACRHYGVTPVCPQSISKQSGHPDRRGMTEIKDAIIEALA